MCEEIANFRVDFIKGGTKDYAHVCEKHLGEVLTPILRSCHGGAARVSCLPATSGEPCEHGVE